MSSNSIGTIFRIVFIFFSLITIWFIPIAIGYYCITLLLGISFSFYNTMYLFVGVMVFRMFFPKNVFI